MTKYTKGDTVYYCGDAAVILAVHERLSGFPEYEIEFKKDGLQMVVQENELD